MRWLQALLRLLRVNEDAHIFVLKKRVMVRRLLIVEMLGRGPGLENLVVHHERLHLMVDLRILLNVPKREGLVQLLGVRVRLVRVGPLVIGVRDGGDPHLVIRVHFTFQEDVLRAFAMLRRFVTVLDSFDLLFVDELVYN